MTGSVTHIWRHPIKSHGHEALSSVALTENKTMPWDRTWAVAHEGARTSGTEWASCANFSRGAKAPSLMAISVQLDEASEMLTLSHPDRPDVTLHPERDAEQLIAWVKPLMPKDRAQSTQVMRVPGRGMTDSDFPSISICNLSSHQAVEAHLSQTLSPERWRGNIWLSDLPAWEETNWIGKTIAIGSVEFDIRQLITRCLATTASTKTGKRDADTLGALKHFGHQEFGIYGVVTKAGTIAHGDTVRVL